MKKERHTTSASIQKHAPSFCVRRSPHLLRTLFALLCVQSAFVSHVAYVNASLVDNESRPTTSEETLAGDVNFVDTSNLLAGTEPTLSDYHLKKMNKRIPLELLRQLQDLASYGDLVKKAGEPGRKFNTRSFRNGSGSGNVGGSSTSSSSASPQQASALQLANSRQQQQQIKGTLPKGNVSSSRNPGDIGPIFDNRAFCQPRRVPVHVPQPSDPMLIYQPMCIQIERCGGCCAHELFHCVPSLTRNATRKVVALRYPHAGSEYFEFEKVTTVKIERHARCKCQCKVQPEDCSIHQVYNKDSCRCICPKGTGQMKCKPPQVWSERDCRCRCPELEDCSTGTYFDPRICRCRSMAEIIAYARIYKNPWLKSYIPEERQTSPPST